jgi:nucleoside-diphosphate-sugar epimerase
VVTGANGWLGSATLAMLRQALGDAFHARVTALGSRDAHRVPALMEWNTPVDQALIVFHYAFLTKDKVSGLSTQEFAERNAAISTKVRSWIDSGNVRGVVLPSSGAVYDHLLHKSRDLAAGLYGQLKYQDEIDFAAACAARETGLIIPRVFNLSGPYINKFDSYALASFIHQVLRGQPLTIHARRPVLRSYYFIGDLIELCLQLMFKQETAATECFDVAGDEVIELGELAQRVATVLADHKPQATTRMPMLKDAGEDCYIGNRDRIKGLENSFSMRPMPLDQQIALTSQYIQSVTQS